MLDNYILSLIIPTLGVITSVITASLSYYFTKTQQIRNENRKLKEEFFRSFIKSVSDVAIDNSDPIAQKNLSEKFNTLTLVGSKEVVERLMLFHEVTNREWVAKMGDNYLLEHDKRLRDLIIEMRRDLFGRKNRESDFPSIHLVGRGGMKTK